MTTTLMREEQILKLMLWRVYNYMRVFRMGRTAVGRLLHQHPIMYGPHAS